MRRLILLRHAKSDRPANGEPDHARGLTPRGCEAAVQMGRYMTAHQLLPDHAIVSTAWRTRETWRLVAEAFARKPEARFDKHIYEASPREILASIAQAPASAKTLLVIGHNPGLHETAIRIATAGAAQDRNSMAEQFPTAALAVIDLDIADWAAIRPGSGRLERFVTPHTVADAADKISL